MNPFTFNNLGCLEATTVETDKRMCTTEGNVDLSMLPNYFDIAMKSKLRKVT